MATRKKQPSRAKKQPDKPEFSTLKAMYETWQQIAVELVRASSAMHGSDAAKWMSGLSQQILRDLQSFEPWNPVELKLRVTTIDWLTGKFGQYFMAAKVENPAIKAEADRLRKEVTEGLHD